MDINEIVSLIADSRNEQSNLNGPLDCLTDHNPYYVQSKVAERLTAIGAWKAGGTNKKTQQYFDTNVPYYGPIERNRVFIQETDLVSTSLFAEPLKGELEICFEIEKEGLDSNTDFDSLIKNGIIKVLVGVELPWTMFPQPDSGLAHLIADVCGANALICGSPLNLDQLGSLDSLVLSLDSPEANQTFGKVSDTVILPVEVLRDFFRFVETEGIVLEYPLILATGGVSACVPLKKNVQYSISVNHSKYCYFVLA